MRSELKFFEVRDRMTFIPVMAILVKIDGDEQTDWLVRRAGYNYGQEYVLLSKLIGERQQSYDPHTWGNRTMSTAHSYILTNWGYLENGEVIDVEFILGESKEKKPSERRGEFAWI